MRPRAARTQGHHTARAVATRAAMPRRATTYRLEPRLHRGLTLLGAITKTPANRMVNEAVGAYLASRTAAVEADLEETLRRVREYRSADPDHEAAIARWVEAEAAHAGRDPAEGTAGPGAGPTQKLVRRLIRG